MKYLPPVGVNLQFTVRKLTVFRMYLNLAELIFQIYQFRL